MFISAPKTNTIQIADMLPSKTVPDLSRKGHIRAQKAKGKTGKTPTEPSRKRARTSYVAGNELKAGDGTRNSIVRGVSIPLTDSSTSQSQPKVCFYLSCPQFHFTYRFKGHQKCKTKPHISILQGRHKWAGWHTRRRW